jgi:hypothetical protein
MRELVWKGKERSYSSVMKKIKSEVGDIENNEYLKLSDDELDKLPSEDDDGLCFYEVGEILLGKESLIRFVKNYRNNGK